jgi:hypothetical protein
VAIAQPALCPRTARQDGFSLHADVAVHENDRLGLERLCRYGLRPPLSLARLSRAEDGRLRYRMKRTFSDGTRELLLTPSELLRRLCALIPPPRVHVTRYHGVFAPHAQSGARSRDKRARAGPHIRLMRPQTWICLRAVRALPPRRRPPPPPWTLPAALALHPTPP